MLTRTILVGVLLLLNGLNSVTFAESIKRDKEIGVITYREYKTKWSDGRFHDAVDLRLLNFTKELGLSSEEISVNLFLQDGAPKINEYKRILIAARAHSFSLEMYQGMKEYVEEGGLLITNSSLLFVDINNDYKFDDQDLVRKEGQEFTGVFGSAWCDRSEER
ncbi:MAG: hypothetical protein PHT33_05290, partial [bacterium]|nr:hypothetical protein [bacterium]